MKNKLLSLPILLVTLGHLSVDFGAGAIPVLLPFVQDLFDLTYTQVGIIVMVQNFTSSVIQPLFGYIIDKVYWAPLLPVGIALAALGISLTGYAPSYYWLLFIIVITGTGSASFHPQGAVVIKELSDKETRGASMGMFSLGGNIGLALGSLFMAFLLNNMNGLSSTIYFGIPGIFIAFITWIALRKINIGVKQSVQNKKERSGQKGAVPLAVLSCLLAVIFIRSTIHSSLQTYIPLYYINHLQQTPAYASYLVVLFLTGGAAGTFIGASLSDRFGCKTIIALSMAASLPLIAAFPYTDGSLTQILVFLAGMALISSFATTLILAQELMPEHVGIASGLAVGFSLGLGGIGTTILGMTADDLGLPLVMTVLAVMPVFGVFLALRLPGQMFAK